MDAEEYRELIAQFLKGTLEQAKPSSWGGKAVLACLDRFRNEDWPGFGEAILLLAVPEFDALQGDLHYLRGNARYAQAEYAEAIGFYEEALKLRTESCQLFTPGLIRYNQFVARSFDPAFSFKEELPRLRETRREAELSDDAYLQGLVLNSYGNHYYFSGQFRRAFRLYRSAFRRFENQSRLLNTLNAIGNTIRAGIQIGAFHESERLIQKLTTRLQETGHSFMKERFDRVFAEYLAARERFEESLIHLDFTQSALAPYESAWMGLLKAQVLLALDQPGAPELLEEIRKFITEHRLKEDVFIDFHATEAACLMQRMQEGDLANAYKSILKAETLSYTHRNSHLRAQVLFQKAKLNRSQGKLQSAARILIEVLKLTSQQGFVLLEFGVLRTLAKPELFDQLEEDDRNFLGRLLAQDLPLQGLHRTQSAVEWLRSKLSGVPVPVLISPRFREEESEERFVIESSEAGGGIYFHRAGRAELVTKTHRMTGKLLAELLSSPNRDVSLDHLHLRLWGGPIRNESHVQKLKTLASRLRAELREKSLPVELESREYATYRIGVSVPVVRT